MENNLEVKNLRKKYNGFELKDINLELPKGMIMGLIGENGAGKTTTIKSILNLIKIDKGEIKIFGLNIKENEKKIKEDIGVVLDDGFFSEHLNPADINKIMRKMYKNWDEKLYFKYLEDFKLPKNKISKEFSSGMKMKLKIAVALSHHSKLLILDEPTNGLDIEGIIEMRNLIKKLSQQGMAILISSHNLTEIDNLCNRIIAIKDGKIVTNDTIENFKKDVKNNVSYELKLNSLDKIEKFIFDYKLSYFTIALTAASPSTATTTTPAGTEIVASLEVITVLAIV